MFNIEKTTEYQALEELQNMDDYASNALHSFIEYTTKAYNTFWFGQVPPEVKIQVLGTKALAIFTASAQAQAFIKSQKSDYVELTVPEQYQINWNEDGSANISLLE